MADHRDRLRSAAAADPDDPEAGDLEDRVFSIPDEADLLLLCLDYLRDLRRAYPPPVLKEQEGIQADYVTLACWALTRAIDIRVLRSSEGNDCWFDSKKTGRTAHRFSTSNKPLSQLKSNTIPSVSDMEDEFLYRENPDDPDDRNKENHYSWYEYDDGHPANIHRFYPLNGLASGPDLPAPLTMGEVVSAGLVGLSARTRRQAEEEMIESPLFQSYIQAVQEKGFFDADMSGLSEDERQEIYDERYRKVVAKFRVKMATASFQAENRESRGKVSNEGTPGYVLALTTAEQQRQRRDHRIHFATHEKARLPIGDPQGDAEVGSNVGTEVSVASYIKRMAFAQNKLFSNPAESLTEGVAAAGGLFVGSKFRGGANPSDLEEAERLKTQGNTHMQKKEYEEAATCYTKALKLSPAGPQSHVYFSNRAAALVSLRQFHEAILDSERSLSLQPEYAKAHARLGLAHFLLGNYQQAKDAYTIALRLEPGNKSNQSYLDKATKRLAERASQNKSVAYTTAAELQASQGREKKLRIAQEKEAEKFKTKGNALMATRDYAQALDAYNQAIKLSPDGPQSHVYYSNRAAALCYLEKYEDAEKDSLKSLILDPTYGKAHARLGLSRFFLHDYAGAVEAYTSALEYDPDNSASQSYLAKAKARLAKQGPIINAPRSNAGSANANRQSSSRLDEATRRLINDENIRSMAARAMENPSRDLLNDPDMREISKKAMAAMRK